MLNVWATPDRITQEYSDAFGSSPGVGLLSTLVIGVPTTN